MPPPIQKKIWFVFSGDFNKKKIKLKIKKLNYLAIKWATMESLRIAGL